MSGRSDYPGEGSKGNHTQSAVPGQETGHPSLTGRRFDPLSPRREDALWEQPWESMLCSVACRGGRHGAVTMSWAAQAGYSRLWSLVFSFATTELTPPHRFCDDSVRQI